MPIRLYWYVLTISLCWIGNFVLLIVAFGLIFVDYVIAAGLGLVVIALYLFMRWRTRWLFLLTTVEDYIKAGQYQAAQQMLLEALQTLQRYGPNNIRLTLALGQIGHLYLCMGRLEEAERFLDEGLALCKKHFGPEDCVIGRHRALLGEVLLEQGRFADAAAEFHAGMEFYNA